MPAVQQIMSLLHNFFIGPSLDKLYDDISNLNEYNISVENKQFIF